MPLFLKQTLHSFFLKGNHHQLASNIQITVLQALKGFFKLKKAKGFSCDPEYSFSIRCTQGFYLQHQNNADCHHWSFQNSNCGLWWLDTKYFFKRQKHCHSRFHPISTGLISKSPCPSKAPWEYKATGIQSQQLKNSSTVEQRQEENPLPAPGHPFCPQEGEAELCQLQNKVAVDKSDVWEGSFIP